jgi:hypothetical protein
MIARDQVLRYKNRLLKNLHETLPREDVLIIVDEVLALQSARKRILGNYNDARKEITELQRDLKVKKDEIKYLNKLIKKLEKLKEEE